MLKLLLVEDDEFFRQAVVNVLEDQGWKVTQAPDGKSAKEILSLSPKFDLIVSDIQMPHCSGVELLEWVKSNRPTPFVMMTGFASIMETQKAHELGAADFLSKPFETDELIDAVKRVCGVLGPGAPAPKPELGDNAFCKVSLEEFVSSKTINFDVYVKLGSRFLKIGRQGDPIPFDRIQNYKEKGLKFLYILREDFRKLVNFNLNLAKVVVKSDQLSMEKKANFLKYTSEIVLEKAFVSGLNSEGLTEAQDFLKTSMGILSDDPSAFKLLETLQSYSDHLYAHSLCTSIYSVLIARKMGWTVSANLFKLSLAGLFHDIGKKEIDRALLEKPRPLLTFAERQIVESHAVRGRDILIALKNIPSEAIAVAYEHHEDLLGGGFPRGIGKHEIHPYAQIVQVANQFSELTLKSPSHDGMSAISAIQHMALHLSQGLSKEAFTALCELCGQTNIA